jgi:hypothetical protein
VSRDEIPTIVQCLACGGNYVLVSEDPDGKYKVARCRWCTNGGMTREQLKIWREHVIRRKSNPKLRL